jgi:hypothetical protein
MKNNEIITVSAKTMTLLSKKVSKKQELGYFALTGGIGLKNSKGEFIVMMSK